MRLDDPRRNTKDHKQDQQHRQADAALERVECAIGLTLVGHHVEQTRAEVVNNHDQERDDDQCSHDECKIRKERAAV